MPKFKSVTVPRLRGAIQRRLNSGGGPDRRANLISLAIGQLRVDFETRIKQRVNADPRFASVQSAIEAKQDVIALANLDAGRIPFVLKYLQAEKDHARSEVERLGLLAREQRCSDSPLLQAMKTRKAQLDEWYRVLSGK